MYSLPQEIEVWYIIPAIRKELASILTKKHGLTFEKTGEILGISKAAISQYLKNKRATKCRLNKEIKRELEISAKRLVKDNKQAVKEIIRVLKIMKKKGFECQICKKYNKGILKQCQQKPAIE